MDFARKQLLKYGWSEGQGLGKSQDGITAPVRASYKFNSNGFGYKTSKEFTGSWWEFVYNKAANNLTVNKDSETVELETTHTDEKPKEDTVYMGSFLKRSVINGSDVDVDEEEKDEDESKLLQMQKLTDEELFHACGGRTAHKGARHGLNKWGKLLRIKRQEEKLLMDRATDVENIKRKRCESCGKKLKKCACLNSEASESINPAIDTKKRKKCDDCGCKVKKCVCTDEKLSNKRVKRS